jgi:predicted esterase
VLPALVEQLAEDYAIDPSRVYVLGHSLGAGATLGLARTHPDLVRAAAVIAGGGAGRVRGRADAPNMPPVLLVSGGLDPLFAPARANAALESLRAVRNGAEHFPYPDEGHTLVVGESMTRVIDWLLAK